jgi:hypothetical protein
MTTLVFAAAANASNPQIAGLQVALRAYGLYNGPIDSIAGPGTVRATKAFQRRVGLVPDGRAGPSTRRALGPLGQPLFGRRTLRRRMFGWDVSVLQFMLARRGALVPVYGYFDGATERALRRYQCGAARRGRHRGRFTLTALARGRPAVSLVRRTIRPARTIRRAPTGVRSLLAHWARIYSLDPGLVRALPGWNRLPDRPSLLAAPAA